MLESNLKSNPSDIYLLSKKECLFIIQWGSEEPHQNRILSEPALLGKEKASKHREFRRLYIPK